MNQGIAIGGPMDGIEMKAEAAKLSSIPIQEGVNRDGQPVFGAALYHWNGFNWIYGEPTKQ